MNNPSLMTEAELEERLSRPTPLSIQGMKELGGDLLVLGMGGKMGPSLVRLARRSADQAGLKDLRIIGVSRFSSPGLREELTREGIETISCDLLDENARRDLPDLPNVLFMLGHKFSDGDHPSRYWAVNTYLPGQLAERFHRSRIVCFSTGNVYPWIGARDPMPTEETPCAPVGEYAITAWGRERMLEYVSRSYGTKVCLLRLNYAVEARYGVPVDIARQILAGEPISLAVPCVNVIWQGYANAAALAAFSQAASPANILNLTGVDRVWVRDLALGLGRRLGVEPKFIEPEGDKALLSNAARCRELFGPPEVELEELLDLIAGRLRGGGRVLDKPTKFQSRDGKF